MRRQLTVASLALSLTLTAGAASASHFSFSTGNDMELEGDRVVLTPAEGPVAEISPLGELRIGGRLVAVKPRDRLLMAQYNAEVHSLVHRAVEIGIQGAGIGIRAVGEALAAMVSGDHDASPRIEAKAATLKRDARDLCKDVNKLRRLQGSDCRRRRGVPAVRADRHERSAHCRSRGLKRLTWVAPPTLRSAPQCRPGEEQKAGDQADAAHRCDRAQPPRPAEGEAEQAAAEQRATREEREHGEQEPGPWQLQLRRADA